MRTFSWTRRAKLEAVKQSNIPTEEQIKKIIRYRFGAIQTNPIRKWEIGEKVFEFKRGSNNTKGLHMSRLGALVRHVFYDKKTQVIFATEGALNRKNALIDDIDFLAIIRFEYQHEILFAPYIPHSLEYLAKVYKYLIQNVIEPDLDVDTLKITMGNVIASTFGQLTVTSVTDRKDLTLDEHKDAEERRDRDYRKFGHQIQELSEELKKHKPYKGRIISDASDYSMEKDYENPSKRTAEIKKILG